MENRRKIESGGQIVFCFENALADILDGGQGARMSNEQAISDLDYKKSDRIWPCTTYGVGRRPKPSHMAGTKDPAPPEKQRAHF